VRYSGRWSRARYEENLKALEGFLVEQGLEAAGEPVFARYDPPFMPWFLRRNEILIPVRRSAGPADAPVLLPISPEVKPH
jgi:hypothetical protein